MGFVYVLWLNNGMEYDEYSEWIAGVFSTPDKARSVGFQNAAKTSKNFHVQAWAVDNSGFIAQTYYRDTNISRWYTRVYIEENQDE